MKNRWVLILAVILLILLVIWMLSDLFQGHKTPEKNIFDYGMEELRKPDSVPSFTESLPIKPTLKEISAITVDPAGKIYVAGQDGVEIYLPGGKKSGQFSIAGYASCITWMKPGLLVIGMEDHVEIYSPEGKRTSKWPSDTNSYFTSVAANDQFIFLADAGRKVVWKYDHSGKMLGKIGEKDPARKVPGFVVPSPYFDVALSPSGELWIANPGRHQLEHYNDDGSFISSWGEASVTTEGFTGCCNPSHFSFLPDGSFVTSEKGLERVKIYSPGGKYQRLVAGPKSFDEGTRGLDLAPGTDGRILVLDPWRNQVRIFLPNETP